MKQEAFAQFGHPELILAAFLMFFISFIGITLMTYRRSQKCVFEQYATMPLKEGQDYE